MKLTHHTKHPCRTLKEKLVWTDPLATYGSSTRGGRLSVFCKCSPFTSANPRRREMTRNTPIDAILNVEENTCDMGVSGLQLCERRAWKHLGYQTMLLEGGSGRGEDFLQVGRCKWCFVFCKAITSLSNWVATRGLIGRNLCFDENMQTRLWPSRFGRIFDNYLKTTTNDFFLVYI